MAAILFIRVMQIYQELMPCAYGTILIQANNLHLTKVCMLDTAAGEVVARPNEWTNLALTQLSEYFSGVRQSFDLPYELSGTAFQHAVWPALASIPYGETRTYQELAQAIHRPKACRAIGSACRCNPLLFILPCHRVIAQHKNGGGYVAGNRVKQALLDLENKKA